jgi:alginate O-acetyltransferase complex protein AlgI
MAFDSFSFLLFFAAVLILDRALVWLNFLPWRAPAAGLDSRRRKMLLLSMSWLFYAGWNPYFLPMLIATSTFDWWLGARLMAAHAGVKKRWLVLSVLSNLGVLGYFKYRFFIAENLDALMHTQWLSALQAPGAASWALPVGISFYTFQSLSYCMDAYRGQLPAKPVSWLDFSLYVAFFPQLVAGPIVRFGDFYPQLERNVRANAQQFGSGIALIVFGIFSKVVASDSLFAPSSDALFGATVTPDFCSAWLAAMAFSGQIFCDFAGYSLCAIGAARALGFWLPDNFNAPYAALGFSDFWRRWHISLSGWLRDYLYIPLGGNRYGAARLYVALSLTMLLGGLWHGAAWTFVIWGGLHGFYLIAERLLRHGLAAFYARQIAPVRQWICALSWLLTLALVMLAWVWFRAGDSAQAIAISLALLTPTAPALGAISPAAKLMACGFFMLIVCQLAERRYAILARLLTLHPLMLGPLLALLLTAIALSPGNARAFIYFQF